jgi:hypothetical protein
MYCRHTSSAVPPPAFYQIEQVNSAENNNRPFKKVKISSSVSAWKQLEE